MAEEASKCSRALCWHFHYPESPLDESWWAPSPPSDPNFNFWHCWDSEFFSFVHPVPLHWILLIKSSQSQKILLKIAGLALPTTDWKAIWCLLACSMCYFELAGRLMELTWMPYWYSHWQISSSSLPPANHILPLAGCSFHHSLRHQLLNKSLLSLVFQVWEVLIHKGKAFVELST